MLDKAQLIAFEEAVALLWEQGKINAPVHLCGGNEDQLIELFKEIKPHDYVFCSHRNHYHALLHGVPATALMDEIIGKADATCQGRARSMGFIDHDRRFYSSAIVGGLCAVAVGMAWALFRMRENDPLYGDELDTRPRVWCFVGDGAMDGGHFWESLLYSESQRLPINFICEDNDRATCTTIPQRMGSERGMSTGSCFRYYKYVPTWPHVGTGKYVQF